MFINRPAAAPSSRNLRHGEDASDVSHDDDLLSKHGGKIAIFGFSFSAALIYRWFIGGKNRTDLEEKIAEDSPLHPYESNELRSRNSMTCHELRQFAMKCREKFPDGYSTYNEFILFCQQHGLQPMCEGYVLDRVILKYMKNTAAGTCGRHSVDFFLVALSNAVTDAPDNRIELMFDIAKNSGWKVGDNTSPTKNSENGNLYCDQEGVVSLVDMLIDAHQVRVFLCSACYS